MAISNLDAFTLAYSQAYFALKREKEYFEDLAGSSVMEDDRAQFFIAALKMEDLLAQSKSANQAAIDTFNATALKGPSDDTLKKAQEPSTSFAKQIATSAEAEAIVTNATKYQLACSDLGSDLKVGLDVAYFRVQRAITITEVRASLLEPSASGPVQIGITVNGAPMLSTNLFIDALKLTSKTAVTQAVILTSALPRW